MATQSVKFHSLSESAYEAATKTDGGLYFINDNGEIRKGGKHVTGTRVFTATDATGTTGVDDLDIYISVYTPPAQEGEDGTWTDTEIDPSTTEMPKKGDMLVVKHVLSYTGTAPDLVEDKVEYSAYVYSANGGEYSTSGWQACDGNVDASKVILTQDYTLAGDYDKVGNISRSDNTFATNGMSVADALLRVFTKELDNSTKTNPSFSLTGSNETLEVGSTKAATTYTATWSDGSYGNKAYWGANDLRTETGTTVGTWTISAYNGKTQANATIDGNTASITTDAFTVSTTGDTQMVSFNVTNDLTNTKKAATNLGNEGTVKITASSVGAQTRKVTGFRYWFYGSNVTAKDYTTVDGNGNATVEVNTNIRALTKVTSLSSMNVVQGATQVVIAVPSNKTLTEVKDGGALDAKITDNFILSNVKVGGADSTAQSIGSYPGNYKVYVMTPQSPLDARTYTIKIS